MEPLKADQINGNWATVLLPINSDNSVDFTLLREEVELLLAYGVNGIYSNGTAGEFYNQTEKEFDRINLLIAEKCNEANKPFQIGCSHMSPIISLERVKRAVDWKPSAIQVILPDWNAPSIKEVLIYLEKMAHLADPIGLVLYNPPHAKRVLQPKHYRQILDAGILLIGCKVAGGDESWYASMKEEVTALSIFVPGHQLATGLALGAHGSYSNVACIHPQVAQEWYEMMKRDMEKALEWEKRIQYFITEHILPYMTVHSYSSAAVDKFLAAVVGWMALGTRLKWPYEGIEEGEVKKVRKKCQEILPEFFNQFNR